jgi:hypothetical protein
MQSSYPTYVDAHPLARHSPYKPDENFKTWPNLTVDARNHQIIYRGPDLMVQQ